MSDSLMPPTAGQVVRSFWDRKEGRVGKYVLIGGGVAVAAAVLFFWGLILPFLIGVVGNTLQLAMLVVVLGALTSPLWSESIRFQVTLAFQQTMRWMTARFIEIDPIGILRTNITQLKGSLQTFDGAVTALAGAKQRLEDDINRQKAGVLRNKGLSDSTDSEIAKLKHKLEQVVADRDANPIRLKIEALLLQKEGYAQDAGFQLDTIKTEMPLYAQADTMYNQLVRLHDLAAFKVESLTRRADMLAQRRSMILSSQSALQQGNKIMKGDPKQLALIDQTVEYLNNEASDTLGAMADFTRFNEKYLTDMDIQNGASTAEAQNVFAQLEKKLSISPGQETVGVETLQTTSIPDSVFASDDFTKLLK